MNSKLGTFILIFHTFEIPWRLNLAEFVCVYVRDSMSKRNCRNLDSMSKRKKMSFLFISLP